MSRFHITRVKTTEREIAQGLGEVNSRDDVEIINWQLVYLGANTLVVVEYEEDGENV